MVIIYLFKNSLSDFDIAKVEVNKTSPRRVFQQKKMGEIVKSVF